MKKNSNQVTLSDALKEWVNSLEKKSHLVETRIEILWPEVMGETIAKYTEKLKYKDNILYISVSSDALRNQLVYSRHQICKLLNDRIGKNEVKEVVLW
jgi:predicted nucleic acid-binding Zn ribbon protein